MMDPTAHQQGSSDNTEFLAPFAQPDFDPVAYAAAVHVHVQDGDRDGDRDGDTLTESRLAFAAQDLSRQIDALVVANHAPLRATVGRFDAQFAHVNSVLRPQLDTLASQCTHWCSSIAQPADLLRSTLKQARSSRDIHALALFLSHLTHLAADALPDLPTHIADPEYVADTSIPSLASTLSDLSASLSLVDLSGIDLVDTRLAPHIAGCRAALLARCNAMVHPKDLARTKLALEGLATLGVLPEWHALRRAKVVGKLDNVVKDWVEAVCAAEQQQQQKSRGGGSKAYGNPGAVLAQFDVKVVEFVAAEAQFLHVLLATHSIVAKSASSESTATAADPWSEFWSAVAASLNRHLASSSLAHASATITLGYPTLCTSLASLAVRSPTAIPFAAADLPTASLAPLHTHYLARIQSLIQSSLTALFQPAHRSSTSSSSSLPPVPTCDAIQALIKSWTHHLPGAPHLVANSIDQLATSLLSLCSDSILLVELFHESSAAPTPAQAQVAHVARSLLCVHSSVAPFADVHEVNAVSERVLADAAQLVDILLQAVIASVHTAILDAPQSAASVVAWTRQVQQRLGSATSLLSLLPPSPTPSPATRDFIAHARLVLVGTLLQHLPALIALTTQRASVTDHSGRLRLVDALASLESSLARVLGGDDGHDVHAVSTFRHLQALRMGVFAGEAGREAEAGWARAARASPVVVGVWRLVTCTDGVVDYDQWTGRGLKAGNRGVGRDVVAWALGWVERWDAAVALDDKGDVWRAWEVVMDRVLGEGEWRRVVGEFGEGEVGVRVARCESGG